MLATQVRGHVLSAVPKASRVMVLQDPEAAPNACEMIKYGEVKALLSGVTTMQGTSPGSQCIRTLIRNAENQANLPVSASHIRTYILDISSFQGVIDWNAAKSYSLTASGNDAFFRQTRSPRWPARFG